MGAVIEHLGASDPRAFRVAFACGLQAAGVAGAFDREPGEGEEPEEEEEEPESGCGAQDPGWLRFHTQLYSALLRQEY